jgi:hypothetical protein
LQDRLNCPHIAQAESWRNEVRGARSQAFAQIPQLGLELINRRELMDFGVKAVAMHLDYRREFLSRDEFLLSHTSLVKWEVHPDPA